MQTETLSLQEIAADLKTRTAEEVLTWAVARYHPRLALASSFGAEDVVLIDMLYKIAPDARIFTLDTGRLHEETYDVMDRIRRKYAGIHLEVVFPRREAVEDLLGAKGPISFRESVANRKECCNIRKVEPLRRVLAGLDAWITGLRAAQSVTRADVAKVEDDPANHLVKVNPLVDWSEERVWAYVREHDVPYNALHDRGFPSIGCAPCTRAVQPGEDIRAGRWWWETPESKECGLHGGNGRK